MPVTVGMSIPEYNIDDFFDTGPKRKSNGESLKLDLYNFDSRDAEGSRYILNSPRSLEACSRLGVKPIELLHKPLAEFEDEYLPRGKPYREVSEMYQEHEEKRLKKLRKCRTERERVILEDEEVEATRAKSPNLYRSSLKSKPLAEDEVLGDWSDPGSLQRRRTAWTTSVGHQRVTSEELDYRTKEMLEDSRRSLDYMSLKDQPGTSHRLADTTSPDRSKPSPSKSIRPASSKGKSTQSRSWSKASQPEASSLSEKDQRILNLMKKKFEDEKHIEEERELARLKWDEKRKKELHTQYRAEERRRQMLAQSEKERRQKQERIQREREKQLRDTVEGSRRMAEFSETRSKKMIEKQEKIRQDKIEMKKREDAERKKKQEHHLRKQIDDEEHYKDLMRGHLDYSLEKAIKTKKFREQDEQMKIKERNMEKRKKYEQKKEIVEKGYNEESESLQKYVDLKQSTANKNFEQQLQRRENEIVMNKRKKDDQFKKTKYVQSKIGEEQEDWQLSLVERRRRAEERAKEVAAKTVEEKALRAHEIRTSKERGKEMNLRRLQEEDEAWKKETEQFMSLKDQKSQELIRRKEEAKSRSRSAARASEDLRDRIKNQYSGGFDKMVRQAEMQARIGSGVRSATSNMSNVKF